MSREFLCEVIDVRGVLICLWKVPAIASKFGLFLRDKLVIYFVNQDKEQSMTQKQKIKKMVEQLPDEKAALVEKMIETILTSPTNEPPSVELGLKKEFHRGEFYDELMADRH